MSEPYPNPPRRGCMSWPLAFVLVVLISAALAAFLVYQVNLSARRASRGVLEAFQEVMNLQPKLTLNDRVVVEQASPKMELTTVTRDVEVEREMVHEWAGSTKRLRVRGVYRVRAGYDLQARFEAHISPGRVVLELPAARILGAEQITLEVMNSENGLWNKVKPEDVAELARVLPEQAQVKAERANITKDAATSIQQKLSAKLGEATTVELIEHDSAPPKLP